MFELIKIIRFFFFSTEIKQIILNKGVKIQLPPRGSSWGVFFKKICKKLYINFYIYNYVEVDAIQDFLEFATSCDLPSDVH